MLAALKVPILQMLPAVLYPDLSEIGLIAEKLFSLAMAAAL